MEVDTEGKSEDLTPLSGGCPPVGVGLKGVEPGDMGAGLRWVGLKEVEPGLKGFKEVEPGLKGLRVGLVEAGRGVWPPGGWLPALPLALATEKR